MSVPWFRSLCPPSVTRHSQRTLKRVRAHPRWLTTTAAEDNPSPLETPEGWAEYQTARGIQRALLQHFAQFGSTQNRDNTFQPHHPLNKPISPSQISLSALLAAGAHFGHAKSLMNPNFMPYAYGVRAGITVIDLDHTLPLLRRAAQIVRSVAMKDGIILFVGTRPDLRPIVQKAADRMPSQGYYVSENWFPGTLTNRVETFGSDIVDTTRMVPDLVVFLNPVSNMHAIRECAVEHVPTIGIVDSNVDPRIVMYPIPANDESTRTAELVAGVLSIAGREGAAINQRQKRRS